METTEILKSNGLTVVATMTTPTRPGKKPRPVFNVTGNVYGYDELFRTLGGKKFRGQWSFWEDPSEAIAKHVGERLSTAELEEYRADRKLAKAERYETYAENAEQRAQAAHDRVKSICDRIPFGQPILIGHHSERSARADQKRIHQGMDKFCREYDKSKYLAGAAESLRHDATKQKSLRFIGNRIKDAETEIRKLQSLMEGRTYVRSAPGSFQVTPEYRAQLQTRLDVANEKLQYWQVERDAYKARLAEKFGRALPGPDSIQPGYFVKCWAGLREVEKVNKASVTVRDWYHEEHRKQGGLTRTIRYHEITGYWTREEAIHECPGILEATKVGQTEAVS